MLSLQQGQRSFEQIGLPLVEAIDQTYAGVKHSLGQSRPGSLFGGANTGLDLADSARLQASVLAATATGGLTAASGVCTVRTTVQEAIREWTVLLQLPHLQIELGIPHHGS